MHIREIHIENIRCFGEGEQGVHLDLTRPDGSLAGWTVIAGRNASAKSTLLKAIAMAVAGPEFARSVQMKERFAGWLRKGASSGVARVSIERGPEDALERAKNPARTLRAGIKLAMDKPGAEPIMEADPATDASTLHGPWAVNPQGWFIAGYGPFRRFGYRDSYEHPGPLMAARLASLYDEDATLAEAVHWLMDVYARRLDLEDQARRSEEKRGGKPTAVSTKMKEEAAELDKLHGDVLSLLNDGLLPEGSAVADLDTRGLWVEHQGVTLPLRNLSGGYRAIIAMVFDILRQMHRCFGRLDIETTIEDGSTHYRVLHEGVALIDEMDAHLHVSWQKHIGVWLKRHFPYVQFIVTTNSPFICQAADPNGLIRLADPGKAGPTKQLSDAVHYTVVNGTADDAIMSELFGCERPYSDAAEELREKISMLEDRLIQGKATKKQKKELARLDAQLPNTPSANIERALLKLSAQIDAGLGARR